MSIHLRTAVYSKALFFDYAGIYFYAKNSRHMANCSTSPRRYRASFAIILLVSSLYLSGCSKWNVEPKEQAPASTLPVVEITNKDVFSISGRGTVLTVSFNVTATTSKITIKELGICYSSSTKAPSLVDASGSTAQAKASDLTLPSSVGVTITAKGTYYLRAYALLNDGRVSYSKADSFTI
ncbi:hypothetical protein WBJ53_22235 [Spirosoma sp. SC4-14]|uniref:hypothetical protein n=1 Tax=Spirosoma sp. SC4-14 TaxID=3128900 RepID=UPI0030D49066